MAFSLAISRIFDEPELQSSENEEIQQEFLLRKSMLTAVTFLVLFTVFVQVRNLANLGDDICVKSVCTKELDSTKCVRITILKTGVSDDVTVVFIS